MTGIQILNQNLLDALKRIKKNETVGFIERRPYRTFKLSK